MQKQVNRTVMNVMRSIIKRYESVSLNDTELVRVWGEIRHALRLKALPIDNSFIDRFVREYGSAEFPKAGPDICVFCNHITYCEVEAMNSFPAGVVCCAKCFVKLEGPKELTR